MIIVYLFIIICSDENAITKIRKMSTYNNEAVIDSQFAAIDK
jgi:hypothetical protein